MTPFFKGASFTPSCSPLDRGTQQHHFLSKLALVMAQYLCPVFSDCSWQVSSNRVTSRNNSASFLSFSASLGSFPSPQFICPLLFGIALLSPQTLPLVCKSTGFLSIVFASVFFFHAQALSLLQGRRFCGRKEGYIPVQLFFPQKNSSYFGVPTLHSAPHQGLAVHDLIPSPEQSFETEASIITACRSERAFGPGHTAGMQQRSKDSGLACCRVTWSVQ